MPTMFDSSARASIVARLTLYKHFDHHLRQFGR
jgi:hypothetical protein